MIALLLLLIAQDAEPPEDVFTLAEMRRRSEQHCIRSSNGEITVCGRRDGDRLVPLVNRWAPKPIRARATLGRAGVSTEAVARGEMLPPALMTKLVIPF